MLSTEANGAVTPFEGEHWRANSTVDKNWPSTFLPFSKRK